MARKRRSSKNKKSQLPMALGGGAAVLALAVGAAVVMKPSERREDSPDSRFSIVDYRHDASRLRLPAISMAILLPLPMMNSSTELSIISFKRI